MNYANLEDFFKKPPLGHNFSCFIESLSLVGFEINSTKNVENKAFKKLFFPVLFSKKDNHTGF